MVIISAKMTALCVCVCVCVCDIKFAVCITVACPVGEYSSIHRKCLVCPAKSWTNESAAEICQCLDGYFRASGETADYPCTSKIQLTAILLKKTNAIIDT